MPSDAASSARRVAAWARSRVTARVCSATPLPQHRLGLPAKVIVVSDVSRMPPSHAPNLPPRGSRKLDRFAATPKNLLVHQLTNNPFHRAGAVHRCGRPSAFARAASATLILRCPMGWPPLRRLLV
jgi:hypothetical protein